jgi:hypothetical protein
MKARLHDEMHDAGFETDDGKIERRRERTHQIVVRAGIGTLVLVLIAAGIVHYVHEDVPRWIATAAVVVALVGQWLSALVRADREYSD